MRLFRRARADRPPGKTPQDADKLALRQLKMVGADLSLPRHVIHFLLFEHESDAHAAAATIDAGGAWTAHVNEPSEALEEWSVRAEGHRIVGAETVSSFRAQFVQIARAHNGEYDGWEAAAKP